MVKKIILQQFLQKSEYKLIKFRHAFGFRSEEYNEYIGVVLPQRDCIKNDGIFMISHPYDTEKQYITCGMLACDIDNDIFELTEEPTQIELDMWMEKTAAFMTEVKAEKGYDSCSIDLDKVYIKGNLQKQLK